MKRFLIIFALLSAALTSPAQAFTSGNAPFCRVDDYGNGYCFYYTLSQCQQSLTMGGFCVFRQ